VVVLLWGCPLGGYGALFCEGIGLGGCPLGGYGALFCGVNELFIVEEAAKAAASLGDMPLALAGFCPGWFGTWIVSFDSSVYSGSVSKSGFSFGTE